MRVKRVVYHDIVLYYPVESFTQLDSSVQAKIVVDMIIAGAVVKVNIPAAVTAETVAGKRRTRSGIRQNQIGTSLQELADTLVRTAPEAVAPS